MSKQIKRNLEIAVISDVHLGTYGCKAEELLIYLKSIDPEILVLNGDIIDVWQFNKNYFPESHMEVIQYITKLLSKNKKIYYITGNHDEVLRKFSNCKIGSLQIVNKLILRINGKKAWFFHGDVFDITMKHSKWLAKLGGKGYDLLIHLNTLVNFFLLKLNAERYSFSKKIKRRVKGAVKFINDFEETAAEIAIENSFDYVICGHIHQPTIKEIERKNEKSVTYLNSGDWVESLTALEFNNGKWSLYEFEKEMHNKSSLNFSKIRNQKNSWTDLFEELIKEFRTEQLKNQLK